MIYKNELTAENLEEFTISVFEPFSDFLMGSEREKNIQISLLDIVKFAGHACPSMIGAFLIAKEAIKSLYPDTHIGIRGQIEVDIANSPTDRATGPMANVLSYITGAWGETGFGGFQGGAYSRRNLLHFNAPLVTKGAFRFTRKDTGTIVEITYNPNLIEVEIDPTMSFQLQWRYKIKAILENADIAIKVVQI